MREFQIPGSPEKNQKARVGGQLTALGGALPRSLPGWLFHGLPGTPSWDLLRAHYIVTRALTKDILTPQARADHQITQFMCDALVCMKQNISSFKSTDFQEKLG
jgi:hypothetical protein